MREKEEVRESRSEVGAIDVGLPCTLRVKNVLWYGAHTAHGTHEKTVVRKWADHPGFLGMKFTTYGLCPQ